MTGADVGEAEQLGCGQVLREGISPNRQLRQKCLLWGRVGRAGRAAGVWGWRLVCQVASAPCFHRLQTNHPWGRIQIKSISLMTPDVPRVGGN